MKKWKAFFILTLMDTSTETWSEDALRIIANEGLKNYLLMGHSYGTVVATVVGYKAETHPGISPPQYLVLSGVVGHAFPPYL